MRINITEESSLFVGITEIIAARIESMWIDFLKPRHTAQVLTETGLQTSTTFVNLICIVVHKLQLTVKMKTVKNEAAITTFT